MNIYDYWPNTTFIRLYRTKFRYAEDFEDLLKFLDLPRSCSIIDIEVEATKEVVYICCGYHHKWWTF